MFVSPSDVDSAHHSGAVVLRLHIVQESPDPHPNLISSEYHLCTLWPPGEDLEFRDASGFHREERERRRELRENNGRCEGGEKKKEAIT